MDHQSSASSPGEPDDDPDVHGNAAGTPADSQKARVRFNSTAGGNQQPELRIATDLAHPSSSHRPPPILRESSSNKVHTLQSHEGPEVSPQGVAAADAAQKRASAMADRVWGRTRSTSLTSWSSCNSKSSPKAENNAYGLLDNARDVPLETLGSDAQHGSCSEDYWDGYENTDYQTVPSSDVPEQQQTDGQNGHSEKDHHDEKKGRGELEEIYNGYVDGSYNVPPPQHYRGGVLSQMLKLYNQPALQNARNALTTPPGSKTPDRKQASSQPGTGTTTPERRKWYERNERNASQDTLAHLIRASAKLSKPAHPQEDGMRPPMPPTHKSTNSIGNRFSQLLHNQQQEAHVKVHIAGTIARQDFIVKLCRALMLYGAPTHRLEEYLTMTARALEIDAQFLYIPGCMLISFDDATTHTTEVKLVRLAQGIDLGRLKDVHRIYKEVIHDVLGVEEATSQLEDYMTRPPKFHPWLRVLIFGLTSVAAAPFSFHARLIDLPLCFLFGALVGALQLIVAPKFPLYANVFEVTSTVLISFLARAFGSIRGGNLFCFSALAQGGIVMLLPGYMFLSSSLELQARAIVPGSIRIVYGVVYSLLLGFGITVGAAIYGLIDSNATSALTCSKPMPDHWTFAFVPPFVLCISILYQAKWRQTPIMVTVAFAGYVVNYFSSQRFPSSPQIASTLGAFAVGALANLYSRFRHGVAAAILIPAIFTQVPGSLASQGGLLSGLQVANEISRSNSTSVASGSSTFDSTDSVVFGVAGSMIQIAIGITVGLFMSAMVIYPLGKKRSGLFSF